MKKKTKFFGFVVCLLVMGMAGVTFAHVGDVYDGEYVNDDQELLKLLIDPSALNEDFTIAMYREALTWNGISSHVEVSVTPYHTGMSDAGFFYVRGMTAMSRPGGDGLGEVVAYDANGNPCSNDSDWKAIRIHINMN